MDMWGQNYISYRVKYVAIITFLFFGNKLFSQPIETVTFRDFPIVQNIDSLEHVVNTEQSNHGKFFFGLLALERSREAIKSYKFGNSLPIIDSLLKAHPLPNIKATYLYLLGINVNLKEESNGESLLYTTKALELFENLKDTSGIVNCLTRMVQLNISHYGNATGDLLTAERYLDRLTVLANRSGYVGDQITALYARQVFYYAWATATVPKYVSASKGVSLEAISLINQYPHFAYWKPKFLNNYANLFFLEKNHRKSAELHLECLDLITSNESNYITSYNYNLGNDYASLNELKKAEKYYLEAIAKKQPSKSSIVEEMNILDNLSNVQFSLKEYDSAWANMTRFLSLKETVNNQSKTKIFLDLQTKYETDKKEQANIILQKEKHQYQLAILFGSALLATILLLLFYLFRKNKQLDAYAHFRDQIFTIISHDLRSPVMALEGLGKQASYLIKRGKINDLQLVSEKIDTSVVQMNSLLNNLLAWAISQDVKMAAKIESFLLMPLVGEIIALYSEVASSRQVLIEIEIPENLMVTANKNGMAVIIRNLVDNAIKNAASKKITVSAVPEENRLVLRVSNNDVIASAETIERIQKQLKGLSVTKTQAASGFGLNLIYYFSKLHNGAVEMKSNTNSGTVFTVCLPQ